MYWIPSYVIQTLIFWGFIPIKEKEKCEQKRKYENSHNLMKCSKISKTKQVLGSSTVRVSLPPADVPCCSRDHVVTQSRSEEDWLEDSSGSICISQWVLLFGLFLLLRFAWPWPGSPDCSEVQCNYTLLRWKSLGSINFGLQSWGLGIWPRVSL